MKKTMKTPEKHEENNDGDGDSDEEKRPGPRRALSARASRRQDSDAHLLGAHLRRPPPTTPECAQMTWSELEPLDPRRPLHRGLTFINFPFLSYRQLNQLNILLFLLIFTLRISLLLFLLLYLLIPLLLLPLPLYLLILLPPFHLYLPLLLFLLVSHPSFLPSFPSTSQARNPRLRPPLLPPRLLPFPSQPCPLPKVTLGPSSLPRSGPSSGPFPPFFPLAKKMNGKRNAKHFLRCQSRAEETTIKGALFHEGTASGRKRTEGREGRGERKKE